MMSWPISACELAYSPLVSGRVWIAVFDHARDRLDATAQHLPRAQLAAAQARVGALDLAELLLELGRDDADVALMECRLVELRQALGRIVVGPAPQCRLDGGAQGLRAERFLQHVEGAHFGGKRAIARIGKSAGH